MVAAPQREIDVAEAMIYNEYAQVLEATNPDTGELYKPEDLNVINWNDYRVAMLQDAIFVREAWLAEEGNRDIAVRFVRASLKGWIYCRDNPADCVQYTTDAGSQLGAGHQNWMMNEINALIWPSPLGVGVLDPVVWNQTVRVAKGAGSSSRTRPDAPTTRRSSQKRSSPSPTATRRARPSTRGPSRSRPAATDPFAVFFAPLASGRPTGAGPFNFVGFLATAPRTRPRAGIAPAPPSPHCLAPYRCELVAKQLAHATSTNTKAPSRRPSEHKPRSTRSEPLSGR